MRVASRKSFEEEISKEQKGYNSFFFPKGLIILADGENALVSNMSKCLTTIAIHRAAIWLRPDVQNASSWSPYIMVNVRGINPY